MELNEYLLKTKRKRKDLIKIAEGYFNKTLIADLGRNTLDKASTDVYLGPSPQRLKVFEKAVNHQLQKIFTPGIAAEDNQVKFIPNTSFDERLRKAYSKNDKDPKRRLFVIIPKDRYSTCMKIPQRLMHNKYPSVSPGLQKEEKKPKFQLTQRICKDDLLLPVLSTVGSHEFRSKIYKY